MGRFNKTIDGVFVELIGTSDEISDYDKFVNYGKDIKRPSKTLTKYTNEYKSITKKLKSEFEKLGKLEELIMQMRSVEKVDDIRLSMVREYIYARCPFYRMGKQAKDIRVIVDKDEFWPNQTVEQLKLNPEFMEKAIDKLKRAMEQELEITLQEYKKLCK
jgi:hypothetical protein